MQTGTEISTRFEHAFRAGDRATIDELCDPGLLDHNPAPDEEPTLAGFKQKAVGFKASFPNIGEALQDIIASGDTVATRWVVTGSQQQEFMGIPRLRPDDQVEGMNFHRLKDGRVTDIWTQFDGVAMMQQLGAIFDGRQGSSSSVMSFADIVTNYFQLGDDRLLTDDARMSRRTSLSYAIQFWNGKIMTDRRAQGVQGV